MSEAEHDQGERSAGGWEVSDPGHAELVQLRIRMIAAENLLLALLAESSDDVRRKVRARAAEIQPRDTASDHPLTERAADEMLRLLARAERRSDG